MAKRQRTMTETATEAIRTAAVETEHQLEEFAEDLGKLLGTARTKAENWLSQRKSIVDHLEGVRDTATQLLAQLGHQAQAVVRRGRKPVGAPASAKRGPGRPAGSRTKKRTMSAEGRARIAAAQKARWAKLKAEGR